MKQLKFDSEPRITLALAYKHNQLSATVRYNDEKDIEAGDMLELLDRTGTSFGSAAVEFAKCYRVHEIIDVVDNHKAMYHIDSTEYLISALHDYYGEPIYLTTRVKLIILDPEELF